MKFKKGYTLKDITPIALLIIVSAIALSIGSDIILNLAEDECASGWNWNATSMTCMNTTYFVNGSAISESGNVSRAGALGLQEFGSWLPTISLVIAAAIVIGVLIVSFSKR